MSDTTIVVLRSSIPAIPAIKRSPIAIPPVVIDIARLAVDGRSPNVSDTFGRSGCILYVSPKFARLPNNNATIA
jgi:hypothetical protein